MYLVDTNIWLERLLDQEKAKHAWLETAKTEGKPIPAPRYRPVIYQTAR